MAVNPYTLQCLYEKGILEYVPYDLMGGAPMAAISSTGVNPYMQSAAQGSLYQNYGAGHDSFTHSSDYISGSATPGIYSNYGGHNGIISGSRSVSTPMSAYGIGTRTANGSTFGAYNTQNALGINNTGEFNRQNALGIDEFMGSEYGTGSYGGAFSDVRNGLTNGFRTASSTVSSAPKIVRDIAAAGIALLGIMYLFKRGRKPSIPQQTNNSGFLSKINPKNWSWFKKN